ncbi:HNH endonuclease signature motif containing protein [Actinospica robiniae]|uniref:HNH endonuclease signature motif containing protein n=1 Tax=Actinospica robiniae TaxID=304901 RepID=UPI0004133BA0|nr:HNH endonuclease signature motif containing protein [Actinospica robiniae]
MENEIGNAVAEIEAAAAGLRRAVNQVLAATENASPKDPEVAGMLLQVLRALGTAEQTAHGLMLQTTARADRLKAAPGGVGPWLAANLDFSTSRARQLALEARTIGALPRLTHDLSAGAFGPDTTRALTRTVRAVQHTTLDPGEALTTTIAIARAEGISAANQHVRVLEHTIDPEAAQENDSQQRARSFLRFSDVGDGFTRIDALLDTVRATILRSAIDQLVGYWHRTARLDKTTLVPDDIAHTEQYNAQALTHLAEVFLAAPPAQREAAFSAPILFYAPLPETQATRKTAGDTTDTTMTPRQESVLNPTSGRVGGVSRGRGQNQKQGRGVAPGYAVSAYGDLVALSALGPMPNRPAHLLLTDLLGQPVTLDGKAIDTDPLARLASPAQRMALGFRDRHCTHPGCDRPALWPLEAHHVIAYSKGGPTTLANLTLVCGEHHDAIHHPHAR